MKSNSFKLLVSLVSLVITSAVFADNLTPEPTPVPDNAPSFLLLGMSLVGVVLAARKRFNRSSK